MKIKTNKEIPKTKYNYLFLSYLFCFPPIHELGHVIICHIIGVQVIAVDWWARVTWRGETDLAYIHEIWEYTPFISLGFAVIYGYLNYKRVQKWKAGIVKQ